jgi:hypothetical protein
VSHTPHLEIPYDTQFVPQGLPEPRHQLVDG